MSRKKSLLYASLLIAVCLLVIEGLSFVGIMFLNADGIPVRPDHVFHPLRDHAHRPNSVVRVDWPDLRTDDFGYIVTPGAPPEPKLTVVLSGSSVARSPQPFQSADLTLAALIQAKLNDEHNLSVEVRNIAVAGSQGFHEFMTIYEYLEQNRQRADMVISVNTLHSVDRFSRRIAEFVGRRQIYPIYDVQLSRDVNALMDGSFATSIKYFGRAIGSVNLNTTEFVRRGMSWLNEKLRIRPEIPGSEIAYQTDETTVELFNQLLVREITLSRMMNEVSQAHGAEFAAFMLPARFTWENLPEERKKKNNERKERRQWILNKFYDDFLARDYPYPVHDLRQLYDDLGSSESPYWDSVHINDIGTEKLAQKIVAEILPMLQSRR